MRPWKALTWRKEIDRPSQAALDEKSAGKRSGVLARTRQTVLRAAEKYAETAYCEGARAQAGPTRVRKQCHLDTTRRQRVQANFLCVFLHRWESHVTNHVIIDAVGPGSHHASHALRADPVEFLKAVRGLLDDVEDLGAEGCTNLRAKCGLMPLAVPDPKYRSIPASVVGGTTHRCMILHCRLYVWSVIHHPSPSLYSLGAMGGAVLTMVTRSRCPRTMTRSTQWPVFSL
jgi:hypothetical protein